MYQPRISDENIGRLYRLRLQMKKPMTHVLDAILNDYFERLQPEEAEGVKKTNGE